MRLHACIAILLVFSACATTEPRLNERVSHSPRLANLQRAAALPWRDEGRCVVQEASQPWPVVVERCFQALDHERIRFHDSTGSCTVASAGAAAMGIGICVLAAPEIAAGAVVILGVVVVAVAIEEALDAYELSRLRPEDVRPSPETKPAPQQPVANRGPKPEGSPSGGELPPSMPPELLERERRPECTPRKVKHRGGHTLHDKCADNVPDNAFPGWDALVNGKNFDALQETTRTLWEVKTNAIETYNPYVRRAELQEQVKEGRSERDRAAACGYDFVMGVRTEIHKQMLRDAAPDLKVVVMTWC